MYKQQSKINGITLFYMITINAYIIHIKLYLETLYVIVILALFYSFLEKQYVFKRNLFSK